MSSSLTYTLTKRWTPPSGALRWVAVPGNWRTRSSTTSPTVAPSAETSDMPPAALRMIVGRRTLTDTGGPPSAGTGAGAPVGGKPTDLIDILPLAQRDRLLDDHA